jgi:hypothetical protein
MSGRWVHCGHGVDVEHRGDKADGCPYCAEDIDAGDYWDMVRWLRKLRRDRERKQNKRKRPAPRLLGPWPSWPSRS